MPDTKQNFPVNIVDAMTSFFLTPPSAGNMTVEDIIALSDMFLLRPPQACQYQQLRWSVQKVSTKMPPLSSLSLFQTLWRPRWTIIRSLKDSWKSQKSRVKDKKRRNPWPAITTSNWQSLFGEKKQTMRLWRWWHWKTRPPGGWPWRTRPPGGRPWKIKPPGGDPWQCCF